MSVPPPAVTKERWWSAVTCPAYSEHPKNIWPEGVPRNEWWLLLPGDGGPADVALEVTPGAMLGERGAQVGAALWEATQ